MKHRPVLCYLENDGESIELRPVRYTEQDLYCWEYQNGGTPESWLEELSKLPEGYYRVEYDSETESESWEYPAQTYLVVTDLIAIRPAPIAGRLLELLERLTDLTGLLGSFFQKCWRIVEKRPGCWGSMSEAMWLPQAIWRRFFGKSWLERSTRRIERW
jgi:hypothetical protein